jgi:hypothetical protein
LGKSIHMSKRNPRAAQRAIYKKNVQKLQRAGLLGDVDLRKKPTPAITRRLDKYHAVLVGKSAVVQAPDLATARRLRKTLGLTGSGKTVVIPREKGERYAFKKSTSEIVSTRKGYNQDETIRKTVSKGFPAKPPPGSDKRLYYTIPARTRGAGRLKRKTFSSFDEMLYYISKYDVRFEDIEDRIEIEEITKHGATDKARQTKIHDERAAAAARYRRRNKRNAAAAKRAAKHATNKGSRGRTGGPR